MQIASRTQKLILVTSVGIGFLLSPSLSRADDFDACVNAYESAQVHRRAGALLAAHEELIVCAQASCPASARQDCIKWLTEVDAALPSIVIAARDAHGRELRDVRVLVDGKPITERLDGKAIPVDPGVHTFRFESAGAETVKQQITVREGEKSRAVPVTLSRLEHRTPPSPTPPAEQRPTPVLVYVLGGVGVAALATSGVFGWLSYSKERDLRDQNCAPNCPADDVDRIEKQRHVSDVALAIGGVALAGAAVLYLTRPTERAASKAGLFVRPGRSLVTSGVGISYTW